MATRYIGSAVIRIQYNDRGDYSGTISVAKDPNYPSAGKYVWRFADLHAPAIGLGRGVAYDSARAYDEMAASAAGFGSYYTSHNRGDDTPDWAPRPDVADAIDEAVGWAQDDRGEYEVRRRR